MGSCLKIKKEIQVINKSSIRYGDIETFFPLEHILVWRYWKILNLKSIKILNYIKPLCIIFILNWFKHFDQKNQTTFFKNVSIPLYFIIPAHTHFYNPSIKTELFLFSHLLTCKNSTIFWDAILQALILHFFI